MQKLIKRVVESAEIRKKPYFIFDSLIGGFCVRISPTGRKNYYFQYFLKTKCPKRLLLGQHGIITAEQARDMAIDKLAQVKAGNDPCLEKTNNRLAPLMSSLAERFMREHVLTRCKPKTQVEYSFHLDKYILPALKNTKISDINKADVAKLQHDVSVEKTKDAANRVIRVLSVMLGLAELWGLRAEGTNPCKYVKNFPMKPRNRCLSKEEATRLGDVLDERKQYPGENLAAVFCLYLLMCTGCRLGEIQTLKWENIDYENGQLRLSDSKTGARTVQVGDVVMRLLKEMRDHPSRQKDNPYVIPGKKSGTYLKNVRKPFVRFCRLAEIHNIRIHDLRHSFASFAVNQGVSLPKIGNILGHTRPQTTSRYAHLMADAVKEAANSITSELSHLLKLNTEHPDEKQETQSVDAQAIKGTNIKAPKYLTSEQAASYLNVHPRRMEYWRYKKSGPSFVTIGQRIYYELQTLKSFVRNTALL